MTAKLNPSQLQSYLDAIQLPDKELQPTLAILTAVHRQHSRNIPFANVTVAREPPQLIELSFPKETPGTSTDAILEKLVYRKWGGYCFENNALLAKALASLGFEVYNVAAKNVPEGFDYSDPHMFALDGFTHQLALVKCSDSPLWYVADCAWGSGTPHQPIAVQASADDESTGATHRIRRGFVDRQGTPTENDLAARPHVCGWFMQRYSKTLKQWQDIYFLTETEAVQPDFDMMNFWHANCKDSLFVQTLRLSIRTEDDGHGRTTMINNLLKVFDREGQLVEQRELDSVEEFKDALASHFGIVPSSSSCT